MITAIVAIDNNYGIGFKNDLLESISGDLKNFKRITKNKVVIMGSNTWNSLSIQPLPQRYNMIITRNPSNYHSFNKEKYDFYTWDEIENYLNTTEDDVYIMGGERVYQRLLPYCQEIYLTRIFKSYQNVDTYFPNIDNDEEWVMDQKSDIYNDYEPSYQFQHYKRIKK